MAKSYKPFDEVEIYKLTDGVITPTTFKKELPLLRDNFKDPYMLEGAIKAGDIIKISPVSWLCKDPNKLQALL